MSRDDVDERAFRRVLGYYPTGVVVVTALVDDAPVGMVVGSFTSVSLDPPLVAYCPAKTSATYSVLRRSATFAVNVLGAGQDVLCRRLAARDAAVWDGVSWRLGQGGHPILDSAVAWIECATESVHDAGDHLIVLARVVDLAVQRQDLPLLFCQGGYGWFAPLPAAGADAEKVTRRGALRPSPSRRPVPAT